MYQGLCHEDPDVFLLGEFHDDLADRKANAILIEALYQEGDIVLVEAAGQPPTVEGQTSEVWRYFELHGWASSEARMAMASLVNKGYLLLDQCGELLQNYREPNCPSLEATRLLLTHLTSELHPSVLSLSREGLLPKHKRDAVLLLIQDCSDYIRREMSQIIMSDSRQNSLIHWILESKRKHRRKLRK